MGLNLSNNSNTALAELEIESEQKESWTVSPFYSYILAT